MFTLPILFASQDETGMRPWSSPLSYTIGTSTMSFLFARRMTVANSYLGTRWVEGKSAVGQGGLCVWNLLIATMGWSLNSTKYATHGTQRVFFYCLGRY